MVWRLHIETTKEGKEKAWKRKERVSWHRGDYFLAYMSHTSGQTYEQFFSLSCQKIQVQEVREPHLPGDGGQGPKTRPARLVSWHLPTPGGPPPGQLSGEDSLLHRLGGMGWMSLGKNSAGIFVFFFVFRLLDVWYVCLMCLFIIISLSACCPQK